MGTSVVFVLLVLAILPLLLPCLSSACWLPKIPPRTAAATHDAATIAINERLQIGGGKEERTDGD